MSKDIKIAEKVKFWEEQDKINQLLIPRVLEIHEQLKTTSLLSQQNSSKNIQISTTLKDLDNKLNQELGVIDNLKTSFANLSNQAQTCFQELQDDSKELSKLFDVTMQDIDTRYKGLIVSITEIKDLFNQENNQQNIKIQTLSEEVNKVSDNQKQNELRHQSALKNIDKTFEDFELKIQKIEEKIEELSRLTQKLSEDIKKTSEIHNQNELKYQAILKNIEKTQKNTDSQYQKLNTTIVQIKGQIDKEISANEKTNQQLTKKYTELLQELEIVNQQQNEQENNSKLLTKIAIGLAIFAIIIALFKG